MKLTLFIYIAIKSYIFELKTFRNRFFIYLFLKLLRTKNCMMKIDKVCVYVLKKSEELF